MGSGYLRKLPSTITRRRAVMYALPFTRRLLHGKRVVA